MLLNLLSKPSTCPVISRVALAEVGGFEAGPLKAYERLALMDERVTNRISSRLFVSLLLGLALKLMLAF